MRRHVLAFLGLLFLAVLESSFLPAFIGAGFRPNLVLIVASTWASLRGSEGFFWAAGGGFLIDMLSGGTMGMNATAYLLGNLAALAFDRIPIPSQLFRSTNWVAVTTAIAHFFTLIWLALIGRPFDVGYALLNVILPLLLLNPSLAIVAYTLLSRVHVRLLERERFAT